ncbi:MAG: DUF2299 family protein [Methanobacteriaceae archaeon]|jgi:hypothetical protein|nr:DUF2299 family protein [Methanobacteriaceae archaeon]
MITEETVQKWLIDESLFKEKLQDENSNFHYIINYPDNHIMDVIQPVGKPDLIIIGCATEIGEDHRNLMRKAKNEVKEGFVWDVRFILNNFLLDFNLQIENNELKHFVITEEIFEDGLTKDVLIRSIKKVFKAKLQCMWGLEKTFGIVNVDINKNDDNNMFV